MIRSLGYCLISACAATLAVPASADAPPFPNKTITLTARNQRVDAAIVDLFGQAGFRVKVSSTVTGKINGVFVGNPRQDLGPVRPRLQSRRLL
jgi:type III secretion protein C